MNEYVYLAFIVVALVAIGVYVYVKRQLRKSKHVTLNIHSSRHVVNKPKSAVLGMAKPTEAQRLRVIHHREREKRNGQSTK